MKGYRIKVVAQITINVTKEEFDKDNSIGIGFKVGSINSIFYFLHKAAEPFNCLEQGNLA